jgi:hypothetical protein
MSDLTPAERLAKLRALEEWLDWQLRDTRRKIEQVADEVRTVHGYVTEAEQQAGSPTGVTVHSADCPKIRHPVATLNANEAHYALLRDPGFQHPCQHCRPDMQLGLAKE